MTLRTCLSNRRRLRLESLEPRMMLSHPAVAAVNVASTSWSEAFVAHLESSGLGTQGYAIPVGSSTQLQTLPWTNVNQIRITFSEDVVITAADLSVSGTNTTAYAFADFSYNAQTHTAVWNLAAPLANDKILLDLDADGMAPVVSVSTAETLDGAWTDCQSTYNSGDGFGGDDFQFRLNVLPGDVNGNNSINLTDATLVYQQVGKNVGDVGYNLRLDVDGSATITSSDVQATQARAGTILPTGTPVGLANDAPTTSGIDNLGIAAGTADYILALVDFFDDAETLATALSYSVTHNNNASLFDSLTIDSSGNLTLDFASNATGTASLTIRAVDSVGLLVDTTFSVAVSAAPEIHDFQCIQGPDDSWTISGEVSDADDAVAGMVIQFGGVLTGYSLTATVGTNGCFSVNVLLDGLQEGAATAQATDPHGVRSSEAQTMVFVV